MARLNSTHTSGTSPASFPNITTAHLSGCGIHAVENTAGQEPISSPPYHGPLRHVL